MDPQAFNALIAGLHTEKTTAYCVLASSVVLFFDHTLTLEREIHLVWPSRWSFAKSLYFLTKYLVLVDVIFDLAYYFAPLSISVASCTLFYKLTGTFNTVGIFIAEVTLIFRTWTIWARSSRIAIFFICLAMVLIPPIVIIAYLSFRVVEIGKPPIPGLAGCWLIHRGGSILFLCYVILVFFEAVIFSLTLYKGIGELRSSSSRLLTVLYRDGMMYYGFTMGITLVNIIFLFTVPSASLILTQRVMHSIFSTRILLNIREAATYSEETELNEFTIPVSLHFNHDTFRTMGTRLMSPVFP